MLRFPAPVRVAPFNDRLWHSAEALIVIVTAGKGVMSSNAVGTRLGLQLSGLCQSPPAALVQVRVVGWKCANNVLELVMTRFSTLDPETTSPVHPRNTSGTKAVAVTVTA